MALNSISDKLLKHNFNDIYSTRSCIIKPITINEINDTYISWLNNEELNQYLEVKYVKQDQKTIINYINSLRRSKD